MSFPDDLWNNEVELRSAEKGRGEQRTNSGANAAQARRQCRDAVQRRMGDQVGATREIERRDGARQEV